MATGEGISSLSQVQALTLPARGIDTGAQPGPGLSWLSLVSEEPNEVSAVCKLSLVQSQEILPPQGLILNSTALTDDAVIDRN